ncbi:MAG: right-handed parallel beta-helix repeat-containing protein [Phycisphaerales bacterium]|nr:right-handed parallel beta-helix repeat-containing protein [Phycisphaerales bacterium]
MTNMRRRRSFRQAATALLLAGTALTLLVQPLAAKIIYVGKGGSDSNAGTSMNAPVRTFAAAAAQLRAGDTCRILAGVYHQTFRMEHSGSPGKPIVIEPAVGALVVIDGADALKHWRREKAGQWSAAMPWTLGPGANQVFLNGRMLLEARFPSQAVANAFVRGRAMVSVPMQPHKGRVVTSTIPEVISRDFSGQSLNFFKGAIFFGQVGLAWSSQSAVVEASSPNGTLHVKLMPKVWWFAGRGVGYLTGLRRFLKQPGQWVYKNNRLYVQEPRAQTVAPKAVEARRRLWCIDFNRQSWVVVRRVKLFAGSVNMQGDNCTLSSCRGRYMGHYTLVTGNFVTPHQNAVVITGDHNTVSRCNLQWSAGCGIALQGRLNVVQDNVIGNMDYAGTYACAIAIIKGGRNKIMHNTLFNCGRDVVQLRRCDHDILEYNDISNSGLLCKDLGLIYAYGTDGHLTRIAYNWIHDNRVGGPGVYLDNGCRNFIVDHNVIWNCGHDAGVRTNGPCAGHIIVNNTLFNCLPVGARMFYHYNPGRHWPRGVKYVSENNLYLGDQPDAQLVNAQRRDFALKSGSKAIGAGRPVKGLTEPHDGRVDLGAYQSGMAMWRAGAPAAVSRNNSGG